jgi:hypothetical protein
MRSRNEVKKEEEEKEFGQRGRQRRREECE